MGRKGDDRDEEYANIEAARYEADLLLKSKAAAEQPDTAKEDESESRPHDEHHPDEDYRDGPPFRHGPHDRDRHGPPMNAWDRRGPQNDVGPRGEREPWGRGRDNFGPHGDHHRDRAPRLGPPPPMENRAPIGNSWERGAPIFHQDSKMG